MELQGIWTKAGKVKGEYSILFLFGACFLEEFQCIFCMVKEDFQHILCVRSTKIDGAQKGEGILLHAL